MKQHDEIFNLFLLIKHKQTLSSLFDFFFTQEELENLVTRIAIIRELLKNEKTQRQIAKDLNVSIAKITRGSNELKRVDAELLLFLKKHLM